MKTQMSVLLFAACTFFVGATEFMVGPMMTPLGAAYGVSPADASWLISAYAVSYALAAPAFGMLSDRINRQRLLQLSLLLLTLDGIALSVAPTFQIALALRVLGGLASAALIPTIFAMIADATSEGQRTTVMGVVMMGMTFGIVGGPIAAGFLTDAIDWRAPYLASALGCVVILGLSFNVLTSAAPTETRAGGGIGWRRLRQADVLIPLTAKACWNGIGVTGFLMAGEVLRLRYPYISNSEIGLVLSAFGAGLATGNLMVPHVKTWCRSDAGVVVAAIALLATAASALFLAPSAIAVSAMAILLWGTALGLAAPASTSLLSLRGGADRGLVLAVSESSNNLLVLFGLPAASYLLVYAGQAQVMALIGSLLVTAFLLSALDMHRAAPDGSSDQPSTS